MGVAWLIQIVHVADVASLGASWSLGPYCALVSTSQPLISVLINIWQVLPSFVISDDS